MSLFFIFKRKEYFTVAERHRIVLAIQQAEKDTSGEIRVFVEGRCRFVNPLDRASEIFTKLGMKDTPEHNAVLIYVAMKHRQLAVFGDQGIHEKVGDEFWNEQVRLILSHFGSENYADGLIRVVGEIGAALKTHFPGNGDTRHNALSDDIVFGR